MERARYNTGPSIQNNNINLSNFWGALHFDTPSSYYMSRRNLFEY